MNILISKNKYCRICKGENLVQFLDLGEMPNPNTFLKAMDLDKPEPKFPLSIYFCKDCGLVQLRDVINPEFLFRDYAYLTSINKPLVDHFLNLGKEVLLRFVDSKKDLVVEIGSNDGVLLEGIKNQVRVLGVDPAKNLIPLAGNRGVNTLCKYFNVETAREIMKNFGTAKVIIANNVVAHINDLDDFLEGIEILLENDGVFIFEVHWAGNFLTGGGWDQFYHEHLSYFSLTALQELFKKRNLDIFDVQIVPIHGESLRVYVGNKKRDASIDRLIEREKDLAINDIETWKVFGRDIVNSKEKVWRFLFNLYNQGKKIAGYGAAAKGNIFLNFYEIGSVLSYIVDDSPLKQNLFTPGTRIPVVSSEVLKGNPPDYILLLVWNYKDDILEKEKEFREKGGKFIIPFPEINII